MTQDFIRVEFAWGHAFLHAHEVDTAPKFTFYAISKTERIKFLLPFPLTGLGSEMMVAVKEKLALDDNVALTLVQTDSINRHEIKPDMRISECTIGAGAQHPILVLQTPLVRFDSCQCSSVLVPFDGNTSITHTGIGYGSVFGNLEVHCGVKYWEVELLTTAGGDGVFLGVASPEFSLDSTTVMSRNSYWGFSCATGHRVHEIIDIYSQPCSDGDVFGVLLDMNHGRLSFYRNGRYLGIAFREIPAKRLHPVFTLTHTGQKLHLLSTSTPPLSIRASSTHTQQAMASNQADNNTHPGESVATFAAGCFWGVELAFQRLHGVLDTAVGYTNGHTKNPTYKQVCTGATGHAEAIRIKYDASQVSYQDLLKTFWKIHDPTTMNRQKNDVGTQYRSGIYYHNEDQRKEALASKEEHQKELSKPIVTEIEEAQEFWKAEEYHQQYLQKGGQCSDKGCATPIRCYG
ncbi:TPA: hypothetical protein N0F65_011211 [Lagenidium giganteum]|uniref:peptide-methionine (S)-S-oxide reductase n=1 Tax=Lagenidium giganteum TaxID=4803 RepID=A0AAV2YT36_9STRA|nr:TPA: hypothetical protein N0F65_011211 [Lagenidium giganteum]